MKKYENYRESGVIGIDEMPNTWRLIKLKYILSIKSGEAITSNDLSDDYEIPVYGGNGIMGYTNKFIYEEDKIIVGRVGAYCGNIHLAKGKKWVSDNALIIETEESLEYLTYLLKSLQLNKLANKNAQPLITGSMVKDQIIPFPTSKAEQIKIVKYLNHQTAIIDQLIQQKKKLIELLKEKRQAVLNEAVTKGLNPNVKMKDSGIEWLGKIATNWKVKKIKHTTFVKGRIGWQNLRADDFLEEGPYLVTGTDFEKGRIKWEDCHRVDEKRYLADPFIILQENDVLITKDGTIGKVAIVKNKPIQVTLNSGVFVTRPLNNDYLPDYMFWLLNSEAFSHFYDFNKSGSTIQHLYQNVFVEFSFALPSLSEQQKIVDYLNIKSKAFDELIETVTNCVDRIKEYRQSIISEAVTGKIDVRNWQPYKEQVA